MNRRDQLRYHARRREENLRTRLLVDVQLALAFLHARRGENDLRDERRVRLHRRNRNLLVDRLAVRKQGIYLYQRGNANTLFVEPFSLHVGELASSVFVRAMRRRQLHVDRVGSAQQIRFVRQRKPREIGGTRREIIAKGVTSLPNRLLGR